jgi:YegS/Rv2252/BmrU family lipid kinase
MSHLPKLGIVLNPTAGRGRAEKIEKQIVEFLRRRNIVFHLEKTNGPLDATNLSNQLGKEYDIIVAVGGDGTVNEVATGLIGSTASLAIFPTGSGNDFNKIIGISTKLEVAFDSILSGTKKLIDLGSVTIKKISGITQIKHFINVLGIGIDAQIAKETKRIKYLRGLPLYLLAAIKALSTYSPNKYIITDGDMTREEYVYLLCAGNGIYEGGGFKMLPNADPSDSKMNICLIKKMSVLNAIPLIPRIINGTHGNHKMISMWNSKSINVSSREPFIIHGDGEIFGEDAMEAKIDLLPNALTIIIPNDRRNAL